MVALMVGRKHEDLFVQGKGIQDARLFPGGRAAHVATGPIIGSASKWAKARFWGLPGWWARAARRWPRPFLASNHPWKAPSGLVAVSSKSGNAREAIDAGVYLVPEDRRHTGLITSMTVRENITLPGLKRYSPGC